MEAVLNDSDHLREEDGQREKPERDREVGESQRPDVPVPQRLPDRRHGDGLRRSVIAVEFGPQDLPFRTGEPGCVLGLVGQGEPDQDPDEQAQDSLATNTDRQPVSPNTSPSWPSRKLAIRAPTTAAIGSTKKKYDKALVCCDRGIQEVR